MTKTCPRCSKTKPLKDFNNNKKGVLGKTIWCKVCAAEYTKEYTEKHKEERRAYNKQYKKDNAEKLAEYNRQYLKKYYLENKEELIKKQCVYIREKRRSDPGFRLISNIRRRLHHIIKDSYKAGSVSKELGCTREELILYLEAKFLPGMTWDNYGVRGWHADHIKALSNFELADLGQFKIACHYTNLQPLWGPDNIRKSNK